MLSVCVGKLDHVLENVNLMHLTILQYTQQILYAVYINSTDRHICTNHRFDLDIDLLA